MRAGPLFYFFPWDDSKIGASGNCILMFFLNNLNIDAGEKELFTQVNMQTNPCHNTYEVYKRILHLIQRNVNMALLAVQVLNNVV